MDVPIVALTQAIDHGRIGLQPHTQSQPVDEYRGDFRPLILTTGLLFDDRGQDQRLIRIGERQIRGTTAPGRVQLRLHALVSALQYAPVGGTGSEAVGVGKKSSLGGLARMAQRLHQLLRRQPAQLVRHVRMRIQRGAHLLKAPAFDHGHRFQHHPPVDQLIEHLARARVGRELVGTRLQPRRRPVQAQIQLHQMRVAQRALLLQGLQRTAQAAAGRYLHPRRLRDGSWLIHLPAEAKPGKPRRGRQQHQQQQQTKRGPHQSRRAIGAHGYHQTAPGHRAAAPTAVPSGHS